MFYAQARNRIRSGDLLFRDVRPQFLSFYIANCGSAQPVFFSDNFMTSCVFANFANEAFRKFGAGMVLATGSCLAAFAHLVGDIIRICSEEKMLRIYTQRSVALVKNMHPIWYDAVRKEKRNSMRECVSTSESHNPIAAIIRRTSPQNTSVFIRFGRMIFKPIFNRFPTKVVWIIYSACFWFVFRHCISPLKRIITLMCVAGRVMSPSFRPLNLATQGV